MNRYIITALYAFSFYWLLSHAFTVAHWQYLWAICGLLAWELADIQTRLRDVRP